VSSSSYFPKWTKNHAEHHSECPHQHVDGELERLSIKASSGDFCRLANVQFRRSYVERSVRKILVRRSRMTSDSAPTRYSKSFARYFERSVEILLTLLVRTMFLGHPDWTEADGRGVGHLFGSWIPYHRGSIRPISPWQVNWSSTRERSHGKGGLSPRQHAHCAIALVLLPYYYFAVYSTLYRAISNCSLYSRS
jgi:hypothetical protein